MSRGPGRIERAIRRLFDANPDHAFITDELVRHCYPDSGSSEKKHAVAVLRAAHKLVARDADWQAWHIGEGRNVGLVFVNRDNVESYALGVLIRWGGVSAWIRPSEWRVEDYEGLRARLDTEDHRRLMAPGGTWHRHVEIHRAQRDGDTERAAKLRAEAEAESEQLASAARFAIGRLTEA